LIQGFLILAMKAFNFGSSAPCVVGQTRMALRGDEVVEFIALAATGRVV
jgi:hypothetical protein